MIKRISFLLLFGSVFGFAMADESEFQPGSRGQYTFEGWSVGPLSVEYVIPANPQPTTPVLVVIPGAKRNADDYRDQWFRLAQQHNFYVVAIGCSRAVCPDEYSYNLGGMITGQGESVPADKQFFSVPERVFADFVSRVGSEQATFALYGHSAGGQFVHLYMLARPDAPVSQAVSANAAFFMPVDETLSFPFGLKESGFDASDVKTWLRQPLTFMLSDKDLGPRTKPLSNSDEAKQQGLNVFSRGLSFYTQAVNWHVANDVESTWKLDIVHGVGHNSTKVVPHALPYLFPTFTKE